MPPLFIPEQPTMRAFIPFEDQWDLAGEVLQGGLVPYQPGMMIAPKAARASSLTGRDQPSTGVAAEGLSAAPCQPCTGLATPVDYCDL